MKKRRLLAVLMTMVLVVSQVPVQAFASSSRLKDLKHDLVDLMAIEYVHPDTDELVAKLNEIDELCTKEENKEKIKEILLETDSFLKDTDLDLMLVIADFNYNQDPSDEYWTEEYMYMLQIKGYIDKIFVEKVKIICRSVCKEAISDIFGKEAIEGFLRLQEINLEEEELINNINMLIDEYYKFVPTVDLNGKTYTDEDIDEAYDTGEISLEEYYRLGEKYNEATQLGYTDIYLRLIKNYNALAKIYGYDNYLEYSYKEKFKRNLTPEEMIKYLKIVHEKLDPLQDFFKAYDHPWLIKKSEAALEGGIKSALGKIAEKVAPELKESYDYMIDTNSCFLSSGDIVGSYSNVIVSFGLPYIYLRNDATRIYQFEELLHEFGHYNADYWNYSSQGIGNLDLQEVYSHGLELLSAKYFNDIFGEAGENAELYVLGNIIQVMWQCLINAEMEEAAFSGEYENASELLEAMNRVLEQYDHHGWNGFFSVAHLFYNPGYIYSYIPARLSALELYIKSKEDYEAAIDSYIKLISNMDYSTEEALDRSGLTGTWTDEKLGDMLDKIIEYFVDTDPPVITGVEDGKVYTEPVSISISDMSGIWGKFYSGEKENYLGREFMISGENDPIRLSVTDDFGNATEVEFIVEPSPFTVTAGISASGAHELSWRVYENATGYVVYGAPLGEKYKKLATLGADERSFVNESADERIWKYYVKAVAEDATGKNITVGKSYKSIIASNGNEKYTNISSIEIKGKKDISLNVGKSKKMSVSLTSEAENKKVFSGKQVKKLRYVSTNPEVATVTDNGRITVVSEGNCYIYCIAGNGLMDRIRVMGV